MNDRFKFRFWRYNPVEEKQVRVSSDLMDTDGYAQPYELFEDSAWCDYDDCICEQCTGLKDKNGKLIYEGDIVELTQARNKGWMLRGTRLKVKYNIDRYCGFGFDDGYALTEKCAKNCIVIGNIHTENEE